MLDGLHFSGWKCFVLVGTIGDVMSLVIFDCFSTLEQRLVTKDCVKEEKPLFVLMKKLCVYSGSMDRMLAEPNFKQNPKYGLH